MKLISFLQGGRETWGAVVDHQVFDLGRTTGIATLAQFVGSDRFAQRDALVKGEKPVALYDDVELLPVIPQPDKIWCAVRNYMDHHQEALAAGLQRELSEFPPLFLRTARSQTAHRAPIVRPRVSETLDWEGELAVIIGKGGRDIPENEAYEHVAGYACYNEASVREWQFHAKQIATGKNFESTGGFGPWMVTAEEIEPGRALKLEVRLNGETVQSSRTDQMIFSTQRLIAYCSTISTLLPGDVIVTGTPSGVGFARKPPRYMQPGDVCEVEIEDIGILRNPITAQA
ncbi:5-carboxymethyl-2-hydroxymuconate isomerase [Variovorax paradoxus]|uniref:5-carboxymethyl-2-hydroxymuconate isomerase n=1 Tax=Variovorax paradoxus TaxID=34073 RepID=A0A5Q0M8C4_VARPD|nr:fumarylacetoacetate hydrolase family protein [Variovorax paradoxus]QFZ85097.1 5-carboxymethyl-2-hydroxymuconate isomerase [Variovorax paradoxus]